jgi:putative hemolysin
LEYSSRSVLRIIPLASRNASLTDDDISHYLQQGVQDGGIRQVEKEIASRVFRLDDRPVRAFMTRRADIVQLDISLGLSENYKKVLESPHTFFPVGDGSLDSILGVISAKDFLVHTQSMPDVFPKHLIRPALFVRAHTDALSILELFKRERRHFAIVLDENSSVCGVVTTHDLMEAIVGDLADYEGEAQAIVRREDGSVLVEAYLDAQELLLYFGIELAEHEIPKEFHSVGGVLFANLPQVPKLGSKITWHGLCLEVVDMDGHRIDKVLVSRSLFNNSGETNFGVTNSS